MRKKNGMTKWPTANSTDTPSQVPSMRARNHTVSSGRFAYQIRKNWEKAMYAQKQVKPNKSLPVSCRCSRVTTAPSRPVPLHPAAASASNARKDTKEPEKKYTPKMVEYQCGWSDRIQSIAAKVCVAASASRAGPLQRRRRAEMVRSPDVSCRREARDQTSP